MIPLWFFPNFRQTTLRHVVQKICCDASLVTLQVKWENIALAAGKIALLSQKITLPRLTQVSKTEIKILQKLEIQEKHFDQDVYLTAEPNKELAISVICSLLKRFT